MTFYLTSTFHQSGHQDISSTATLNVASQQKAEDLIRSVYDAAFTINSVTFDGSNVVADLTFPKS